MYGLIWLTDLRNKLENIDLLIMMTSAVCHDLDHTGYNNAYQVEPSLSGSSSTDTFSSTLSFRLQINARTELALRYNDISPLENHHCAVAFQILQRVRPPSSASCWNQLTRVSNRFFLVSQRESNIFRNLSSDQYKRIREGIIK